MASVNSIFIDGARKIYGINSSSKSRSLGETFPGRATARDHTDRVTLYEEYLGAAFMGKYPSDATLGGMGTGASTTSRTADPNADPNDWKVKNISALVEKIYAPGGPYERGVINKRALDDFALSIANSPAVWKNSSLSPRAHDFINEALGRAGTDAASVVQTEEEKATVAASGQTEEAQEKLQEAWEEFAKEDNSAASINKEQQFLIINAAAFGAQNANNVGKQKYQNFINILGEPHETIAAFNSKPGMGPLLDIKPYQRALIVPKMRLFKVYRPDPNKPTMIKEKEFIFKTFTEVSSASVTKNKFGRGTGVGITKLNVEFQGTNLYAAKREMKVQLGIHFQNFKSLATDAHLANLKSGKPMTTADQDPSYLDLVWRSKPKTETDEDTEMYNPKHFEIKLVLGWSVPPSTDPSVMSPELKTAIANMTTAMYLSQIDHTFSFNQDGSIDLLIDYRGRIDLTLTGPKADLLYDKELKSNTAGTKKRIKEIREKLKDDSATLTEDKRKELQEELKKLEEKKKGKILDSKKEKYINIVNRLLRHDSMYFTDVDFGDLIHVLKTSRLTTHKSPKSAQRSAGEQQTANIMKLVETAHADDFDARIGAIGTEESEEHMVGGTLWYKQDSYEKGCNSYRLNYFYFGDLLDIITEIVRGNYPDEFDDINYLLTSFAFDSPGPSGEKQLVPMASIPVSLNYFTSWMLKKVIQPQKAVYFLLDFVRDFINDALIKAFGAVLKRQNVDKKNYGVKFGYKVVSLPPGTLKKTYTINGQKGTSSRYEAMAKDKGIAGQWAEGTPSTPGKLKKMLWGAQPGTKTAQVSQKSGVPLDMKSPQHCVILFPYTYDLESLNGNYEEDMREGTYHLGLGRSSGIVNEINFNKSDIKFQSETAFERSEDSIGQMKRVYNATVSTMGNTLFYPGSVVYLDPTIPGLGRPSGKNSVLAEFGLGGYYTVTKVDYELSVHDFQTTLNCIWRASGDGTPKAMPEVRKLGGGK